MTVEDLEIIDSTPMCDNPGCTRPPDHVDHDHLTGEVRGVLCRACNTSLGLLGEDPARIEGLLRYLGG